MNSANGSAVALEDFIQAVQTQLDTAQARMTLKAQNDRLPLTFAIRDITMDLKAHVEMQRGEVQIRPAGPADTDASVLHLVFAAITKPMIEENAVSLAVDNKDDVPLDALGDALDEDERRRLEMVGVRTVSKLNEIERRGIGRSVGRITNLPIQKLQSVLAHASRPLVEDVSADGPSSPAITPGASGSEELRRRLLVRGRNLLKDGTPPQVSIGGKPVGIVRATDRELVLAPKLDQFAGQMSLSHGSGPRTELWFDQSAHLGDTRGAHYPAAEATA
jgi:hypothetical protein